MALFYQKLEQGSTLFPWAKELNDYYSGIEEDFQKKAQQTNSAAGPVLGNVGNIGVQGVARAIPDSILFLLSKGSSAASTTADLVKTSDAALAKPAINILDKINGLLNKANKTVKVQEESDRFLDAAVDDWINSEKTAKAGAELKWPETIEEALDLPPKPQKPDLELPHLAGNSAKGYTEGAGVSLRTDDITSIYRAVGPNEYYSVVGSGKFDTVPTGMEVKQFGLDMQDTINFAERYPNIAAVLEVKIPKGILNNIGDFTKVDTTIFKNGTVTIQPENLDIFNKYLKEILHIY